MPEEGLFRVSVRELVAFRYFPPDIAPMAGVREMLAGGEAHRARQAAHADEYETERPVRAEVECGGYRVAVFGRMDGYRAGEVPLVEEIKLCGAPPDAPLPEHLAQARVYAALLAVSEGIAAAEIRLAYVNEAGELQRAFTETMAREALLPFLTELLAAWLGFAAPERERRRMRDESIRAAAFPFPSYRAGQRELAVQVYTAITRRKRLFASLPTGTGKSAAVLYPALKALAEGKTRQVVYLTARTTARQSPLNALEMMRGQGLRVRVTTVLAKEKLCPAPARCHPDDCPRARGHFLRQPDAIRKLAAMEGAWTDEVIAAAAEAHSLCPFELALALTDLADVVLMDMNYAFDPFAQIARMFKARRDFTLLTDEAHHLLDRVRESLSGALDTRELRAYRAAQMKALGRRHAYVKAVSALVKALEALGPKERAADADTEGERGAPPEPGANGADAFSTSTSVAAPIVATAAHAATASALHAAASPAVPPAAPPAAEAGEAVREARLDMPPPEAVQAAQELCDATFELLGGRLPLEARREANRMVRKLAPFLYAAQRFDERYAALLCLGQRWRKLELYCLSPAEMIAQTTRGLKGAVFFSATLSPLHAMRDLLGGGEEDACFSLPSPFPPENLAVRRRRVQTRYAYRAASADEVAAQIAQAVQARPGKYIAYFPSYAYLRLVRERLEGLPLPPVLAQDGEMTEEARARFLMAFTDGEGPLLGLCVLGGLFSEGVDLPGEQLVGAVIVGVGLPTPSPRLTALQTYYEARFGDGFLYAWMIPAMQKVSQAGGRVIRTESDRGTVLLLDERYFDPRYARLLPPHWQLTEE